MPPSPKRASRGARAEARRSSMTPVATRRPFPVTVPRLRRAVDDDVVVAVDDRLQRAAQDLERVRREVRGQRDQRNAALQVDQADARGRQLQPRDTVVDGRDPAGDRLLDVELGRVPGGEPILEPLGDGAPILVHLGPLLFGDQRDGRVGLRIEVDEQDVLALLPGEHPGDRHGRRGLADAAPEVDEAEHAGLLATKALHPARRLFAIPDRLAPPSMTAARRTAPGTISPAAGPVAAGGIPSGSIAATHGCICGRETDCTSVNASNGCAHSPVARAARRCGHVPVHGRQRVRFRGAGRPGRVHGGPRRTQSTSETSPT